MVKKLKKLADQKAASPTGLLDGQLAQSIKDSAQQIWLAGLGAFAKAQGEGTQVFDTLMKEGASLHRKTQAAAEEKLGDMAGKVTSLADGVTGKANAQWDKLESIFEERTARAMNRLGVPTARDVAALAERVDALAAAVARLGKPAARAATQAATDLAAPATGAANRATRKSSSKAAASETEATPPAPSATKPRVARKIKSAAV